MPSTGAAHAMLGLWRVTVAAVIATDAAPNLQLRRLTFTAAPGVYAHARDSSAIINMQLPDTTTSMAAVPVAAPPQPQTTSSC